MTTLIRVETGSADVTGAPTGAPTGGPPTPPVELRPGVYQPASRVEAWRFVVSEGAELATWCGGTFYEPSPHYPAYLTLDNEAGDAANVGDWVVRGPDGTFRAAHDTDFRATYEPKPPTNGGGNGNGLGSGPGNGLGRGGP